MTENETIVNSLEVKINKLISLQVQLKTDNQRLLSEKEELQNALMLKDNEFKDLDENGIRYEKICDGNIGHRKVVALMIRKASAVLQK